jgi:hypothetical protein
MTKNIIFKNNQLITKRQQLTNDFGEYPPKPLLGIEGEESKVRLRKINKINFIFIELARLPRAITSIIRNKNSQDTEVVQAKNLMIQNIKKITTPIKEIKEILCKVSFINKIFSYILISTLFPLVALILLLILTKKIIFGTVTTIVNSWKNYHITSGSFTSLLNKNYEIILHNHISQIEFQPIVSHEHIHSIQNRHRLEHIPVISFFRPINLNCNIFLDEIVKNEHYQYLLNAYELEARLHELVLSAYKETGLLPLKLEDFVDSMLSCTDIQVTFTDSKNYLPSRKNLSFQPRSNMIGRDIIKIFLYIKDDEARLRVIREVLSVSYGNLLKYYGDTAASKKFLSQISMPNLYNKIY